LSPEGGESKTNSDSSLQKWENGKSPMNPFKTNESIRSKRHNGSGRRKESKHYQESDILESPSVYEYCRSNLGDKISDYEDLWTQENNSRSSLHIPLNESSKECEASMPMVISPPQQPMTPLVGSEIAITTISTPMQAKTFFDSNKKSPFYSDPVDAVVPIFPPIVRREPKLNALPSFHRYSEPPKGQFDDMNFHTSPLVQDKSLQQSLIAASLDHLKSTNRPANVNNTKNNNNNTWAVDSSWEFVDKNDDSSESSSVRNTSLITPQNSFRYQTTNSHHSNTNNNNNNNNHHHHHHQKFNTIERNHCAMSVDSYLMNSKKSNIYKLVARKYPDINLKGVTSSSSFTQSNIPSTWQTFDSDCSNKFQRLSSYDNVVEQHSICGDSEDGTLFSEPWDTSQWDSFFPTTDGNHFKQFETFNFLLSLFF
jgi:Ras and Rab interactor 2/3